MTGFSVKTEQTTGMPPVHMPVVMFFIRVQTGKTPQARLPPTTITRR